MCLIVVMNSSLEVRMDAGQLGPCEVMQVHFNKQLLQFVDESVGYFFSFSFFSSGCRMIMFPELVGLVE